MIFCKYNFWWNVTKSKKIQKYFLKIMGWEISEYFRIHLYEKFWKKMKSFRIFLSISEKCFNSYKTYEKNFYQKYVSYQLSTAEPGSAVWIQADYVLSWRMRGKGNSTFRTINSWEDRFVIGILYFNVHTNARTTWHETSASWIIKFYFVIDCKLQIKNIYCWINDRQK